MTAAPDIRLRTVDDSDLDTLFHHQADPEAAAMAAFGPRDRDHFDAHWAKIRRDETLFLRTILADCLVAGVITGWPDNGNGWSATGSGVSTGDVE